MPLGGCARGRRASVSGALFFSLLVAGAAALEARVTITLTPPFVEKTARPGDRIRDAISLHNDSDVAVRVRVAVVDFEADDRGNPIERPSGSTAASLARHFRISPAEATVPPGQRFFFRYSVEVPEDLSQLRGLVFFSSTPVVERLEGGAQAQLVPRMGVPIYVENRAAPAADLVVEEVSWDRVGDGDAVELTVAVTNRGGRNIRPTGFIQVEGRQDRFHRSFQFNGGRQPVLPGHRRVWRERLAPVPRGELSLSLRFTTSSRAVHEAELTLAAVVD